MASKLSGKILLLMNYFTIAFLMIISIAIPNEIKYVSTISFIGNTKIHDADLRSIIKLQAPMFFNRSKFSHKKLNKDKIALQAYYRSKGFLEVDIITEFNANNENYINIKYFINEGNQYRLRDLIISGNKLFTENEILSKLDHTSINQYYNPVQIRKKLQLLKRDYLINGKVDISIMDEIVIEAENVIARINIYEGNTYRIRDISITGLEKVKRKYVLRELLISTGDLYNINQLDKTRQGIFNSGLFSSVEMNHNKFDYDIGLIDVEIKVREYKSSSIEANFGFKQLEPFQNNVSVTGLETHARWITGNVMRTSSNIEVEARLASEITYYVFKEKPLIERDITITYRNPWTLFFRIPSRIKYFHKEESDNSNVIINGITYSLLFNKDIDTHYEINSTMEIIESGDSLYSNLDREPARHINIRYISNKVNNPLNPRSGNYLSLSTSIYGTVLGGERHFLKISSEYRRYFELFKNNIIAARVVFHYIKNLENNIGLPPAYQLKLGGQNTLRGWAGPSHPENADGALISDMFNIEYRFPILKEFGGFIFLDCGRLFNNIYDIIKSEIIWDYGLGIVYNTKLGPIRLDMGFPFGDVSHGQLHASLLYMF